MNSPAIFLVVTATAMVSATCGPTDSRLPEMAPFDPQLAAEEMAAFQLGLVPPVEVVAYLASMCNCGDFVLIDSAGSEIRVRHGGEMWSGYPSGFTIDGQESEDESTSRAAQHVLGVWFNRNCSFEQETLRYPPKIPDSSPDTSHFLCPLLYNFAVNTDACYLLDVIIKPNGQEAA